MKHSNKLEKLQKRIQAWEDIKGNLISPNTKTFSRSSGGTNAFRKPGSQKK